MNEHDQLSEQYLEAQLREELGIEPDLSESVLREYYAKHPPEKRSRVIPPPRRRPAWRPLAAAAAVLLAAGLATYSLVRYLPQAQQQPEHAQRRAINEVNEEVNQSNQPDERQTPAPESNEDKAVPDNDAQPNQPDQPTPPDAGSWPKGWTDPPGALPVPDRPKPEPEPELPDDVVSPHPGGKGWTDPPGAFPDPTPDKTSAEERPVLVAAWKADSMRVTREGSVRKLKQGDAFSIRAGDLVSSKDSAELTLMDGGLLRLDGELSFDGEPEALTLTLHDGALYADVTNELSVTSEKVTARVSGVSVLEQRLRGFDVFCLSGSVKSGDDDLTAGYRARLEDDGFRHDKAITWADVQNEFRFLRETPRRVMLREELNQAPGELFGGELKAGILSGEADGDTGIGFYFRDAYAFRDGDVVRFRFRVGKACEMILQFGTAESGNWRHKLGGVKADEWIDYELPLSELYKTTDVAQQAEPGLIFKFFQLHPEDAAAHIEIDSVEIVHQP